MPSAPSPQSRTLLLATDSKNSLLAELAVGRLTSVAYAAYGHQSAQHGVMACVGFNGELRESQTSWYFLGNGYRVYHPRLMRFHSPDSWSPFGKGGLNAYMYCGGEPVMGTDPTGHLNIWKWPRNIKSFFIGARNQPALTPPKRSDSTTKLLATEKSLQSSAKNSSSQTLLISPTSTPPPVNRSSKPTNPVTWNVSAVDQIFPQEYANPVTRPLPLPNQKKGIKKGVEIDRDGIERADLNKFDSKNRRANVRKLNKVLRQNGLYKI